MNQNEIKSIFNSSIRNVVDNISQYTVQPEKDLLRKKNFLLINWYLSLSLKVLLRSGLNCLISSTLTMIELLPRLLTSNGQNLSRKPSGKYCMILTSQYFRMILHLNIVIWLPMVQLQLISANHSFLPANTLLTRSIPRKGSTVCISMHFKISKSMFIRISLFSLFIKKMNLKLSAQL